MGFQEALNKFVEILDTPNVLIGNGLDYLYDNTIGELTNTRDAFTGEDLKIIPEIASFAIPGMGAIKGIKFLKNLANISKFEKAMKAPKASTFDNAVGTIAGHVGKYGEDIGAKRAARQFGQYTKADKLADVPAPTEIELQGRTIGLSKPGLEKRLDRMKTESPTPLYRGGDESSGWFYTPDKRVAKSYRRDAPLRDWIFNRGDARVSKLPAGTPMVPGRWYEPLSTKHNIAGREVIVKPDWIK